MNCPNCGHPNRAGVNFCENCGANLAPPPPPPPPRRAYAPARPGCPAGFFTSCLNWALGFILVGAILGVVLVFLCVIDVPAPPYQTMLPDFAIEAWERLDDMQARNCSRSGGTDNGGAQAPQPDGPKGDEGEDEGANECNRSKFVRETIPDHTVMEPGEKFTKSWTVRNAGTCTWTTDYTFRFTQGTRMGGPKSMNLPRAVKPGEEITLEVDLTAPDDPGSYTGRWEFFDEGGDNFGWYSVVIDVGEQGAPPKLPDATVFVWPSIGPKCETNFAVDFSGYGPNETINIEIAFFNDAARYQKFSSLTSNADGEVGMIWVADVSDPGQYIIWGRSATAIGSAVFIVEGEDNCACGEICIEF